MLLGPFVLVGISFTENVRDAIQWLNTNKNTGLGRMPGWVERLPLIGASISEYWFKFTTDAKSLLTELQPHLEQAGIWLLKHSLNFAQGILQLAMSVVLAFFIYRDGDGMVERIRKAFMQISGEYGNRLITVTKTTVQSVVYGMIGTGLAQGIVAGLGFAIAGVPSPTMLGLFTFFLSFVPAGPPINWIGASLWLLYKASIAWGIFMLVYGFFVISMVDNVIKPYIISRGSKLPFIIMLIGVIGGIASFGFIGVFIGPTILALGYSLAQDFLSTRTGTVDKTATPSE
jgi:predicted PurR-regulated permease PerM